jgi:hypothetical protein
MRRNWIAVLIILLVAGLFRVWLMADTRVAFESDEAIVGLMARHINQGKAIPTFFYGQAYMGSLDAILVAGGFQVLGESVQTIRAVQLVLYLLALVTGYALAVTVTHSRRIAGMALLLLAIPTAVGALYTTITLGGYNEIVVLGNIVLLLGWQVTVQARREAWRWALLGVAAGIGWWSNGAIITALLVTGLIGLRYFSLRQWRSYALAAAGFLIGSAPWWVYNLQHDWAALNFLTGGFRPGPGVESISPSESLIGLLVLGPPALYGLRYPWEAGFSLTVGIAVGALVYLVLVTDGIASLTHRRNPHPLAPSPAEQERGNNRSERSGGLTSTPGPLSKYGEGATDADQVPSPRVERGFRGEVNGQARRWVWIVFGVFVSVFTLSSFSDSTGRYLMPVWVPAAIGIALGLDRLRRAGRLVPALLLGGLLVMQASTVIRGAQTGVGLTPQLVARLRTPAADDTALIDFLRDTGYTRGYASYWTSFRVMFRAREAVIFDTSLPYDERGTVKGDNRYPPYVAEVAAAARVVWVTQNFPELDTLIAARLAEIGITYQTLAIGRYRVYYDFSARIAPADVGLTTPRPFGTEITQP